MKKNIRLISVVSLIYAIIFFIYFLLLLISAISLGLSGNQRANSISPVSFVFPCVVFFIFFVLFLLIFISLEKNKNITLETNVLSYIIAGLCLTFIIAVLIDFLTTKQFCNNSGSLMLHLGCILFVGLFPITVLSINVLNNKYNSVVMPIVFLLPSILFLTASILYLCLDFSNETKRFFAIIFIILFSLTIASTIFGNTSPKSFKKVFAVLNYAKLTMIGLCIMFMLIDSLFINWLLFGITDFLIYFPLMVFYFAGTSLSLISVSD